MSCYGEYLCFVVKVSSVGVQGASSVCAEGYVLGGLKFGDVGVG